MQAVVEEIKQEEIKHCIQPQFFQYQSKQLQRAINEHKWYLSERAHHDVGFEEAKRNFEQVYFQGFAAGFRVSYCGLVCPNRNFCIIGKRYAN